jgi:hypothetical protein
MNSEKFDLQMPYDASEFINLIETIDAEKGAGLPQVFSRVAAPNEASGFV